MTSLYTGIVLSTPLDLAGLAQTASDFVLESTASSTRRAYRHDVEAFETWAGASGLSSLPAHPTTVGLYLTYMANGGKKVSTIERALAAISQNHTKQGLEWRKGHPAIRGVLKGIKRTLGAAPAKKTPISDQDLLKIVAALPSGLGGIRDRALLTVGWFGAFRRSELCTLNYGDIRFSNDGLIVTLSRSKTDQEGRGYEKGLPYTGVSSVCPVRSLRAWLDASGVTAGPLFRSVDNVGDIGKTRLDPGSVGRIVKRAAASAGVLGDLGGHSLRSGFATTAAAKGKSLPAIMRMTGHKNERIAMGYIRPATIFQDNAAAGIL